MKNNIIVASLIVISIGLVSCATSNTSPSADFQIVPEITTLLDMKKAMSVARSLL